jgi:hypothetical protein
LINKSIFVGCIGPPWCNAEVYRFIALKGAIKGQ